MLIVSGMVVEGIALAVIAATRSIAMWTVALVALGIGTALVYPTLLAAVGDVSRPAWRASAVGVYRFWRDMGYLIGALLAGFVADVFGLSAAITTVGVLTVASGLLVGVDSRKAVTSDSSECGSGYVKVVSVMVSVSWHLLRHQGVAH